MEEKARRINISSTGRAINNGDKQGWVSNSQTRVTPQTPQAAQCIPQAEQAQAAQCKGGVLILRKWMTEKVGLVRCFSPGVKRNRRAKNSTVFMQCTVYSVQCVYIYVLPCTHCRVLEGTPRLTRPALSSCHTSQRVTCLLTSYASPCMHHVTRVTQILHKSHPSCHVLKIEIYNTQVSHMFLISICVIYVWINMANPKFPFLEQDLGRIIGAVTRCKVIMSER